MTLRQGQGGGLKLLMWCHRTQTLMRIWQLKTMWPNYQLHDERKTQFKHFICNLRLISASLVTRSCNEGHKQPFCISATRTVKYGPLITGTCAESFWVSFFPICFDSHNYVVDSNLLFLKEELKASLHFWYSVSDTVLESSRLKQAWMMILTMGRTLVLVFVPLRLDYWDSLFSGWYFFEEPPADPKCCGWFWQERAREITWLLYSLFHWLPIVK